MPLYESFGFKGFMTTDHTHRVSSRAQSWMIPRPTVSQECLDELSRSLAQKLKVIGALNHQQPASKRASKQTCC